MRRLFAAGLLLLLAGCRQKENTPLQIDPALEALVPANTVFIMGVNVDAVRNTQVYQKYIGVLGPQRRTREALAGAARLLNLEPDPGWVESWLERMNAPTGLDLGADTPATIALSIISEIQKTLTRATAQPLREVRATNPFHLCKSSRP